MFSFEEILFDEEPHTYRFRNQVYDSVTQVIRMAGLGDDFSKVSPERMEYARRRGRMVHLACHYYDDGELNMDSVDPAIRGYVEAYVLFRHEKHIKPIAVEEKIISPHGCALCTHGVKEHPWMAGCDVEACSCKTYIEGLGVAGTPDIVCWMDGRRVVIDRKTSQHMSASMGLQTAGYLLIWNQKHMTAPIHERYGLRLEKTGKYKLVEHDDPCALSDFEKALRHSRSFRGMEALWAKYRPNLKRDERKSNGQ